jgi:Skp family chaperone for outer membrane proteins
MTRKATLHQRVTNLEQVALNLVRTLEALSEAQDKAQALMQHHWEQALNDAVRQLQTEVSRRTSTQPEE